MVREGEAFGEVIENPSKKKKTPKQFRSQDPKVIEQGKPLTMAEKKLFKEAFITDKGRLHKRQQKFNKPSNHILIMQDNVLGKGAPSSGKYMMYGEGELKDAFLQDGLKYDMEKYYIHANHIDFQKKEVKVAKKSRSKEASPKKQEVKVAKK